MDVNGFVASEPQADQNKPQPVQPELPQQQQQQHSTSEPTSQYPPSPPLTATGPEIQQAGSMASAGDKVTSDGQLPSPPLTHEDNNQSPVQPANSSPVQALSAEPASDVAPTAEAQSAVDTPSGVTATPLESSEAQSAAIREASLAVQPPDTPQKPPSVDMPIAGIQDTEGAQPASTEPDTKPVETSALPESSSSALPLSSAPEAPSVSEPVPAEQSIPPAALPTPSEPASGPAPAPVPSPSFPDSATADAPAEASTDASAQAPTEVLSSSHKRSAEPENTEEMSNKRQKQSPDADQLVTADPPASLGAEPQTAAPLVTPEQAGPEPSSSMINGSHDARASAPPFESQSLPPTDASAASEPMPAPVATETASSASAPPMQSESTPSIGASAGVEAQSSLPQSTGEPLSFPPPAALPEIEAAADTHQGMDLDPVAPAMEMTPFNQAAAAIQRGEKVDFAPKPDTTWVKAEKPMTGAHLKFAQKLTKELMKQKEAGPFVIPVDPYSLNLPTYWAVITQPVDLGTVQSKLSGGAYSSLDDYAADVRRIFQNCYRFNGIDAPVSVMARHVEPVFESKISKAPNPNAPQQTTANKSRKSSSAAPHTPALNSAGSRRESGGVSERPKREIHAPSAFDQYEEPSFSQKKKSAPRASSSMLPDEIKFCKEVMRELNKKAYQAFVWPFNQPVDWEALGLQDYPQIITRPMDLGTMKSKLDQGHYFDAESFHRDFKLCVNNCVRYNGSESDVGKMAKQMDGVFNAKWAEKPEMSDDDGSDDEQIRMMESQLEMMRSNLDALKDNRSRKRADRIAAKNAQRAADRAAHAAAVRKSRPPPPPRPAPAPKPARRPSVPEPEPDPTFEDDVDDDFDFDDAELADSGPTEKAPSGTRRRKSKGKKRNAESDDDFFGLGSGAAEGSASAGAGGSSGGGRGRGGGRDDSGRNEEITFEMKQELANGIGAFEGEKLEKAIDIIRKSRPDLLGDESKEIELDIDSLDNGTLLKLYTFVVRGGNKNKPKRQETLTARGHRAQKGGRAGTGGLKGKSLDEAEESAKIKALEEQLAAFEKGQDPAAAAQLVAAGMLPAESAGGAASGSQDGAAGGGGGGADPTSGHGDGAGGDEDEESSEDENDGASSDGSA